MVTAYILATTKIGKEKEVLDDLLKLEEVKEAYTLYGDYDILTKVESPNLDALNSYLLEKIRKVQHLSSSTTLIGI